MGSSTRTPDYNKHANDAMPPRRKNTVSGRIKWTEDMTADHLICRGKAMAEHQRQSGQNIAPGCRRKGYMELMRLSWEEKGYASLGLTAQNLRDKAAQLIRSQERNRQENANAEEQVCSNESSTFEVQEGNQQERVVVVDEICINEEENNANYTSSAEHTTNTPIQFQWGELSGEVFVQSTNGEYEEYLNNTVERLNPNAAIG